MGKPRKIYLVCGSGGVGKTTISAALGLHYARRGYKTIVLTIDPAKRLATSLGIEGLSDIPKQISINSEEVKGELWAMMLDTKRTFDRIVEKYAPNPVTSQKIFNNRLYQHMSNMLAGTQEYMAMERLFEVSQNDSYEIIILDTPPMQNALDFLAAPQKMMNMIDNSMLQILLKPTIFLGRSGLKLFERSSKQILKVLDKFAGFVFLQDLAEMFLALKDLLGGFRNRANQVKTMLTLPNCYFISICTTNDHSVAEVEAFQKQLAQNQYQLKNIIVNRVYVNHSFNPTQIQTAEKMLNELFGSKDGAFLLQNYQKFLPLIENDNQKIEQLTRMVGKESLSIIPLFNSDVHDLSGLENIADNLADFD